MMKTNMPRAILKAIKKFQNKNFEIYLVGGAVRNFILDKKTKDWDLTTNAQPEEIQKLFPKNSFYKNRYGTVTVVVKEKVKRILLEITTFRKEFGYSDKRHPDKIIWGKTLKEDLARREFTVSAIALEIKNINLKSFTYENKIIDPYYGQKDLKDKILRTVGNPEKRFSEDALRMMRAVRIASQLGLVIEKKTFVSIKKSKEKIKKIAWERIRDELFKILASSYPAEGILVLYNTGLLYFILPELIAGRNVAQARHHVDDVWNHSLKSLQFCPAKDPIVRLACLLHDIGKPATAQGKGEERTFYNHEVAGEILARKIAGRLRLSRKDQERLCRLIRYHQFTLDEKQTDKAFRRFIKKVKKENIKDMLDLRIGDRLGGGARETSWRLELFKKRLAEVQKQPFSLKYLKVNGQDVMRVLKIPPGPKVGKILKALFKEIENDKEKNARKYLLSQIKKIYSRLPVKEQR
ncbi:MAG: HD domain-containing protein [Candidatus Shapirobacteria bacterium]